MSKKNLQIKNIKGKYYYLVEDVPVAKPMVMNGAGLLPKEEISKSVKSWNMKPVVMAHTGISAASMSKLDDHIGFVVNSRMVKDRLFHDFMIEKEFMDTDGHELLNDIRNGKEIHVSTAYFDKAEDGAGTHEGRKFDHIQTSLQPDHVAILRNEKGACSSSDGCGINVNNQQRSDENMDTPTFDSLASAMATEIEAMEGRLMAKIDGQIKLNSNAALPSGSASDMEECADDKIKKLEARIAALEKTKSKKSEKTENSSDDSGDDEEGTENKGKKDKGDEGKKPASNSSGFTAVTVNYDQKFSQNSSGVQSGNMMSPEEYLSRKGVN